jgi:hypothetical protein
LFRRFSLSQTQGGGVCIAQTVGSLRCATCLVHHDCCAMLLWPPCFVFWRAQISGCLRCRCAPGNAACTIRLHSHVLLVYMLLGKHHQPADVTRLENIKKPAWQARGRFAVVLVLHGLSPGMVSCCVCVGACEVLRGWYQHGWLAGGARHGILQWALFEDMASSGCCSIRPSLVTASCSTRLTRRMCAASGCKPGLMLHFVRGWKSRCG